MCAVKYCFVSAKVQSVPADNWFTWFFFGGSIFLKNLLYGFCCTYIPSVCVWKGMFVNSKLHMFSFFSSIHTWPLDFTEWPLDLSTEGQSDLQVYNGVRNTALPTACLLCYNVAIHALHRVDVARQPWKVVHLGEGKLWLWTSPALWPYPFMGRLQESTPRKLESESLRQSDVVYSFILATSATTPMPSCIGTCPSLGVHWWHGEGDLFHQQQLVFLIILPRPAWRRHSASFHSIDTTWEAAVYRL